MEGWVGRRDGLDDQYKTANEGEKNKSEEQTKTLKNKENRRNLGQRERGTT
jgi:hypothetical protein